ncbi:MAG: PAS domain-containing protein [candidate division Zixibacteria bacterium]|nr:PAS domain-containing protein [candidate division Zixibacteria bacterium]
MAIGVVSWMKNRMRRTLTLMVDAATRFARGDWEARIPIDPFRRSDEFSELAHDFNRLADDLTRHLASSRRERDQLQTVLANMSDAVLAVDSQGVVRLVNHAFLRLFRSAHPDPVGHPQAEAFRNRPLSELIERLLAGNAEESEEIEIGEPPWRILVIRTALIPGANADDVRGVLVARDVTARRRVEQMRRDFVANVSHELRTPLTSIIGYVAALRETVSEGAALGFLDTVERNAARMDRIIGDLLELSRLEARGYHPALAPLTVSATVEEARLGLSPSLERKSQSMTITIAPDAETLRADPEGLARILANLLDNASKYTPDGGTITVSADRDGMDLVLVVADNGTGVPEGDQPRLFERFFRVDRGRSRDLGGTGLGLSIVKHVAEAHGGSARYEPNSPFGSRFVIRLPQPDWANLGGTDPAV